MSFMKIAGPFRVDTFTQQNGITYPLAPRFAGVQNKVAQYQIVVLAKSTQFQIGLRLYHGPVANDLLLHSTPISVQAPTASGPTWIVSGDADTSIVLGAWLRPVIETGSGNTAAQWGVIEVYQMLKPF